jgi:glycosyltransferase involved in cell wall biosynthesis
LPKLSVMQLLPALESGGVERGTLEIAEALVAAGHESLVVSGGGRLVEDLTTAGSEHFHMAIGQKSLRVLACVGQLRQLIRNRQPDIVHARSRLPAWVAWQALKPLQAAPVFVTTLHGLNSVSRYSRIMTRGERVIAVSESCRDYWLQHYHDLDAERVCVINRGIDPVAFPYGYKPSGAWREQFLTAHNIPEQRLLLALPGRVSRLKAHGIFLRLLARLVDGGVDCQGLVVGACDPKRLSYGQELRDLAKQLGIARRVTWTGYRSDIREVLALVDLVLSLSGKPESFGRTVIEALALGRPVAAWDQGGVGEILNRVYPCGAVAAGDFETLLERCESLLAEAPPVPDQQPYLKAIMQAETLELYRSLVRGK